MAPHRERREEEDGLGSIRDPMDDRRYYSKVEIERIADDRAKEQLREMLRAMGLDPDKPAETAEILRSVKNIRRGVIAFLAGIVTAAAGSFWLYLQAHFSFAGPRP